MKYKNSRSGFSLVEVLVAITILLMVVTGPMTMISRSNTSTAFATEQVNAFFLAQEGLELAQKGRDDLLLQYLKNQIDGSGGINNPMTQFMSTYSNCFAVAGCGLVINSDTNPTQQITACSGDSCRLYLTTTGNAARSMYVHSASGNTQTPYTRVINMEAVMYNSKVQEIKVTSTVTWRTGSLVAGQRVQLVSYLANVYDTN